jgi:hypothetical protein
MVNLNEKRSSEQPVADVLVPLSCSDCAIRRHPQHEHSGPKALLGIFIRAPTKLTISLMNEPEKRFPA